MRKRISAWLLALVMVISLVPSRAFAAAGDVPAHSKTVTDNGDGTYTIALNVTGETEKKVTKVNVVVVLDTSGSMSEYTGNTTTTYRQVTASQAYWYNEVYGYVDGEYVLLRQEFDYNTWSVTYYVGDSTEPYEGDLYVQGRSGRETRLEAATAAVKSLSDKLLSNNGKDGNPDDVVEMALVSFATKAAAAKGPTTSPSTFAGYLNSLSADGGTNWEGGLTAAQNVNFGDQDTTYVIFVSDGNPTFRDSQYNSNWNDYNRNYGVYGSGQEQDQNVSRSYQAAQAAAEDMVGAGYKLYTIGVYGNVDRMQGLGGEGYYSASNTDALNAALTEILAKIEEAGIGSVEIEDGTTASVTTPYGGGLLEVDEKSFKYYRAGDPYSATANGGLGDEWTDAPEATLTNGNVTWDLGDDLLENGVTYTVTFDVWPSQDTLDLIADIKNDPSVYDDLDDTLKQYLRRDGSFKTNTGATLSYEDTRTGQSYNEEFTDPDPVTSESVQLLTVSKEWQNQLDGQAAEPVTLTVTRDGEEIYDVSLSNDNSWQDTVYISIGIMREDGTVLTSGHDFTFTEPEDLNYHWELDVPVVRPMQIGENVTMLIKVDEKHQPEGAKTYTIDGAQYYVGEVGAAALTAVNYRRSSLNLTKVVEGEGAPEDAEFTFKLTVTDPEDEDIWFSVMDESDKLIKDITTSATPEDGDTGYYHFSSGSEITVDLQAGWNLRILNLPTGSTYTITEGEMEPGFIFTSAELAITEGDGADSTFSGGRTTTGTIEDNNTLYTVTYTNEYALVDVTVDKVWDDADDQDGIRPDELELTVNGLPQGTEAPDPEIKESEDGNTWTYTWSGLPKYDYDGEEITYTVTEGTVPEGYTCEETTAEPGGTITNTHEPETEELTVTKVWDDAGDQDELRPDSVTFTVTGSDGKTYDVELTGKGDEWTATVEVQKYYNQGEEVTFEVDEAEVAGYEKTIDNDTLTITNKHDTEKTTITVTKVWDDNSDQDGKRPDSVKFTVTGSDGKTYEVELSGEGDTWTADVEVEKNQNTRALVTFTVDEEDVDGYEKSIDNDTLTITNTYEPETEELTVTKVWDDADDQDGKRPDSVKFTVTGSDGNTYDAELSGEGNEWTATVEVQKYWNQGEEVTFTVDEAEVADYEKEIDNENLTITNSYEPETEELTVTKVWDDADDQDGKRPDSVTFTVTGSDGKTYDVELTGEGDTWTGTVEVQKYWNQGEEVTFEVDEAEVAEYEKEIDNENLTITNSYEPETAELTVTKVWDDASDQDEIRPDSVKFTVTGSDGKTYEVELTGKGDTWTATVEVEKYYNGGEEVTFTVDEADVADYEKSIDNDTLTITNKHNTEKTTITVTKVWEDNGDQDGKRPDSVKFTVTGSDGKTYEVELTGEGDTWTADVEVEKNQNTRALVTFTVDEEDVEGYEKSIDNDTLTITNSYEPETEELTVTKVWDDSNDKDGKRPESVKFTVTGSDGKTYEVELTGEGNTWTATVEADKYYNSGEEVTFEVDEAAVADYEKTIDNSKLTITNKHTAKENPPLPPLPPEPPVLNTKDHFAYIIGNDQGLVLPNAPITRAEVATIFFRMLTDESRNKIWSQDNPFSDVKLTDWYNNAISTMTNGGILTGYPDGSFRPDANITRAEFATIAIRFFKDAVIGPSAFSDTIGHWAEEYINKAATQGLIKGYPDGTFRPNEPITRAEAMTIVNRVLNRHPDKDHLLANMIVWPDNMDTNMWYYADVQEATNSHDYEMHNYTREELYEVWKALLPVRDWAAFEKAWSTANSAYNPGEVVNP